MSRTITLEEFESKIEEWSDRLNNAKNDVDVAMNDILGVFEELSSLVRPVMRAYYNYNNSEETKKEDEYDADKTIAILDGKYEESVKE